MAQHADTQESVSARFVGHPLAYAGPSPAGRGRVAEARWGG